MCRPENTGTIVATGTTPHTATAGCSHVCQANPQALYQATGTTKTGAIEGILLIAISQALYQATGNRCRGTIAESNILPDAHAPHPKAPKGMIVPESVHLYPASCMRPKNASPINSLHAFACLHACSEQQPQFWGIVAILAIHRCAVQW